MIDFPTDPLTFLLLKTENEALTNSLNDYDMELSLAYSCIDKLLARQKKNMVQSMKDSREILEKDFGSMGTRRELNKFNDFKESLNHE